MLVDILISVTPPGHTREIPGPDGDPVTVHRTYKRGTKAVEIEDSQAELYIKHGIARAAARVVPSPETEAPKPRKRGTE